MSKVSSRNNKNKKMAEENSEPKRLINPTAEDFKDVSKYGTYMDHSLLIKVFYKQNTRLFISVPRMFGKSTNLTMIWEFFKIAKDGKLEPDWRKRPQYEMFKKLDIIIKGNEVDLKNHLGAHPVVYMNFCYFGTSNSEEALEMIHYAIRNAFNQHEFVLKQNLQNEEDRKIWKRWENSWRYTEDFKKYTETGLRDLCRLLYETHGKKRVLILMDNCDTVMRDALTCYYDDDRMRNANLMSTILDSITVGDVAEEMIQGVLLTGLNNISGVGYTENPQLVICGFLDDTPDNVTGFQRKDIVPFFGLHEEHLDVLLSKVQEELKFSDQELERKRNEIKMKYGGYYTRMEQKAIYPLYWVIEYVVNGRNDVQYRCGLVREYEDVLTRIGINSDLVKLYGFDDVVIESSDWKLNLKDLIKMRKDPTPSSKNVFLMMLLDAGYLTYADSYKCNDFKRKLRVPNGTVNNYILQILRRSLNMQ